MLGKPGLGIVSNNLRGYKWRIAVDEAVSCKNKEFEDLKTPKNEEIVV